MANKQGVQSENAIIPGLAHKPPKWLMRGIVKSDQGLVSRNLLDGLLRGVPQSRQSEARALYRACGYNPDHPHAFYAVTTFICLAEGLGKLLFPGRDSATARFALGELVVRGYVNTVPGRLAAARMPKGNIMESLRYSISMISHELSMVRTELREMAVGRCAILIKGYPLAPEFMQGVLVYTFGQLGCQQTICNWEAKDECNVIYDLHWASFAMSAYPDHGW